LEALGVEVHTDSRVELIDGERCDPGGMGGSLTELHVQALLAIDE
jgi:hypothetical protein